MSQDPESFVMMLKEHPVIQTAVFLPEWPQKNPYIHVGQRAIVSSGTKIGYYSVIEGKVGEGCVIDHHCVVRPTGVVGDRTKLWFGSSVAGVVGERCTIGHNCHIYEGAKLSDEVTLECNIDVWDGVAIEDGAFVGPDVTFTNDPNPRGYIRMKKKYAPERGKWLPMLIKEGATIGANATILPGLTIGKWAVVAAGAVVTKDVADYEMVAGNPARHMGWICECFPVEERHGKIHAMRLPYDDTPWYRTNTKCRKCGKEYNVEGEKILRPSEES